MSDGGDRRCRSSAWFGASGKVGFFHRAWFRTEGLPGDVIGDRPVIAIANTGSDLVPCNAHFGQLAEAVKRGVWEAGGLPLTFNTLPAGETVVRPTTMLYRNLLALEVEEALRANPVDGVVLLGGCDKTTPALLMGAASVDLPSMMVTGGPMLSGRLRGETIGCGTDVWRLSEEARATDSQELLQRAEAGMVRSHGFCQTMGTASTMACLTEALGIQAAGTAALPAVDARRYATAQRAGRRVVELVAEGRSITDHLTREAFENAIVVNAAIGGSTNAILHLLALAGRCGIDLQLADFDRLTREVPLLVDVKPSGRFLMEELCYAGGVPAVMAELEGMLHLGVRNVDGRTVEQIIAAADCFDREVIRTIDAPLAPPSGTAVLFGTLAPGGAVIKRSAASPRLMHHTGTAVVFDGLRDYRHRVDDPDLDIDENSILVLRNAGPRGYPGMPEIGNLPLPRKLLEQGVDDLVRISDARMSGTAYGTVVLHTAPEAAVGGPLALVQSGDRITLDVDERRLDLLVDEAELARRQQAWSAPATRLTGYQWLYAEHVLQATHGVDFDFLVGNRGSGVPSDPF